MSDFNYNLTPEQWEEVKIQFQAWQEVQTRKAELAAECKDICKRTADIFDGKQTDASKLFKNMKQKWEGEEPEAFKIATMLEQMDANGGGEEE